MKLPSSGSLWPLALLALTLALSCPARAQDPVKPADEKSTETAPEIKEGAAAPDEDNAVLNNSARGLAGLKASGEAADAWEATSVWKDYAEWMDHEYNYIERVRLTAMRSWSGSELGGIRGQTKVVFYPFSGPDVLYADTLFPDSKTLVMAGLEPVGSVPNLGKLQQAGKLPAYLHEVRTSMLTILTASFFKTKDMKNDFSNESVDGLLPAMMVFIARQGYSIDSIEYVTLDHDGTLSKGGRSGVQINYGDGRTLYYFSTDLGNDGLRSNPGYVKLMARLGPGVTYLKAASYLLYEDYFSIIREGILDNSVAVVEDDSGIPFHDFNPAKWDVIPYGNYSGPIGLFKEHYQTDLEEYYKKTSHSSLSFGSGYKFTAAVSSLLVAKKK